MATVSKVMIFEAHANAKHVGDVSVTLDLGLEGGKGLTIKNWKLWKKKEEDVHFVNPPQSEYNDRDGNKQYQEMLIIGKAEREHIEAKVLEEFTQNGFYQKS